MDRQVAEEALAGEDVGKLVALGVAFVVAAFLDELCRLVEFFARGLGELVSRLARGGGRRRGPKRREAVALGQGEAAEF